jgi:hypothetical protein
MIIQIGQGASVGCMRPRTDHVGQVGNASSVFQQILAIDGTRSRLDRIWCS